MKPKVTYFKDDAGQWRWRFQAGNGRVIADSGEGYHNRADAVSGFTGFVGDAAGQADEEIADNGEVNQSEGESE